MAYLSQEEILRRLAQYGGDTNASAPSNVIDLAERRRPAGGTPPSGGGGGDGPRMAGDALAWLQPKAARASRFLGNPRVIGGGLALAGLSAALAAANEASTQDPTLSGLQAAARPIGAAAGQLGSTAIGTGIGALLGFGTPLTPLTAAAGGFIGSMLPGADVGADIAGGLAGVIEPSQADKDINTWKKQQRAQMEMELERLPIARALAQEQLANEIRAARAAEVVNSQARASQALWSGLNYAAPSGAEIYGTVI